MRQRGGAPMQRGGAAGQLRKEHGLRSRRRLGVVERRYSMSARPFPHRPLSDCLSSARLSTLGTKLTRGLDSYDLTTYVRPPLTKAGGMLLVLDDTIK